MEPGSPTRRDPGACWKLGNLALEGERGRRADYLGRARLTNLVAWSFYANLKVCYRAVGGQAAEAGRPVLMDSPGDGPILPATSPLPPARHVWVGKIISAILLYHRAWHGSLIGLFVLD